MTNEQELRLDSVEVLEIVNRSLPRIVEAVKRQQSNPDDAYLDQKIGLSYRKMRMEKGLTIDDAVRIVGDDGFGTLELLMFEHGLISYAELGHHIRGGLISAVPEFVKSEDLIQLFYKESEKSK